MSLNDELYVRDLRPDNDGSLGLVPRIHNFDELEQWFHVNVDRSLGWDAAPPGQPVFKLVGFSVRPGPSFFNRVFKQDGSPFPGVLICAWYPGHKVEPNWQPLPRYEAPAFGDFTNGEGTWGLAVGGLVMPDADTGGPLVLWVNAHPDQYADAVRSVGWYPLTDHLAPCPEWMYVTKTGGTVPPSNGEAPQLVFVENGVEKYHILFQSGLPPQDSIALALKQNGQITHHVKWLAS